MAGVYYAEVPPVPIPNTEVKLSSAEDTWREAAWKNRSSPAQKAVHLLMYGFFTVYKTIFRGIMAVRKKNRRVILWNGKRYIWYVAQDKDSSYHLLNVVSEDKQLIIACPLNPQTPYLISKGHVFQKQNSDRHWSRYELPFPVPEIITPKFVRTLVEWSVQGRNAVEIRWNGKEICI